MIISACGDGAGGGSTEGAGGNSNGMGGASGQGGAGGASAGTPVEGQAVLTPSCAPNDGKAFTIEIGLAERSCTASPMASLLRLSFWTHVDMPAGNTWNLSPNIGEGQGNYTPASDPANFIGVDSGTLKMDVWTADSASGNYDVILMDGTHLSGSFDAIPCLMNPAMCG